MNKLENFIKIIKNCCCNCDNCSIYETYVEKYSDENLINMVNEAIEYIKGG